jgi:hypothetical protein
MDGGGELLAGENEALKKLAVGGKRPFHALGIVPVECARRMPRQQCFQVVLGVFVNVAHPGGRFRRPKAFFSQNLGKRENTTDVVFRPRLPFSPDAPVAAHRDCALSGRAMPIYERSMLALRLWIVESGTRRRLIAALGYFESVP